MQTQTILDLFLQQYRYNPTYQQFVNLLNIAPERVNTIEKIPFLPIAAFKHHEIQTLSWHAETVFQSSGTTDNTQRSRHLLRSRINYQQNALKGFESVYGAVENYCFLALLPNYLSQGNSSLVFMVNHFIEKSKYAESGFFLYDFERLDATLRHCELNNIPTFLIGVSYALLDFAESYGRSLLDNIQIMETGGMKGRRRELPKMALHQELKQAFGKTQIHSEYGMTELLSQAYAPKDGIFQPSPSLKVLIRDSSDPLQYLPNGKTGCINLIDLANKDTCAFIATDDLGRLYDNGQFEVLGRLDAAEIRGCNLLVETN
jgi:phenylacetate-coenzyme A ligase PaaK-like adenylate-forming protein